MKTGVQSDAEVALEWFQENIMELENPKPLSCNWTQDGRVVLIVSEENEEYSDPWLTIMWTNYLNETGYQRDLLNMKSNPKTKYILGMELSEPMWEFWK